MTLVIALAERESALCFLCCLCVMKSFMHGIVYVA